MNQNNKDMLQAMVAEVIGKEDESAEMLIYLLGTAAYLLATGAVTHKDGETHILYGIEKSSKLFREMACEALVQQQRAIRAAGIGDG